MKPSFALSFTDDGIQLLHRAGRGWTLLGETPFAAPDLDDALDYLRKTALGLEPGGFTTKLVIPNSQIRYLEIDAPGPDDAARRAQIAAVLEATTPLKADEIAFDWSGKGRMVKVAALDKATLAEAEGFAVAHRFNPVAFVAIPEDGTFGGEPWFGETEAAASLLNGETVERDRSAIRVQTRTLPGAAAPAADSRQDELPLSATARDVAPAPETEVPMAPAAEAEKAAPAPETAEAEPEMAKDAAPLPAPVPEAEPEPAPEPEPPAAPLSRIPDFAEPVSTGAAAPAPEPVARPEPSSAPSAVGEPARTEAPVGEDIAEAPFAHVPDNPAFPEDEGPDFAPPPKRAEALTDPAADEDLPPPPSAAAMAAFASRRTGSDGKGTAPALGAAQRPDPAALTRAARGKPVEDLPPMPRPAQAGNRPAPVQGLRAGMGKGLGGLVTAPTLPGGRKPKAKATPPQPPTGAGAATPADAARSLTRPGGTFGMRPPAPSKSRTVLFLSLVAVLLLCLALVAAWSSFYLASQDKPADPPVAAAETDVAATPAVEDEMLADGELLPDEAGLATEDPAVAPPADEATATAEASMAAEAPVPGVSADEPAAQSQPQQQDEIFVATADPPPPALDALSLPVPEAAADALPGPQMPPPPFGTVYAFDAKGLLIPTPEGIVSPEGVLLIAGKPPLVPPPRSEAAAAAALAAAAAPDSGTMVDALPVGESAAPTTGEDTETTGAPEPAAQPDPDLEDRRPRPRPEGLTPTDDAALPVEEGVNVTSLRPRERPAAVLAAAESARAASPVADAASAPAEVADAEAALAAAAAAEAANPSVVAISRRPAPRPGDFTAAVEAAVAAAIRAPEPPPEPEPEPEAQPEPAPKKTAKKEPAPDLKPEEQDEIDEPEVAAGPAPKIPTKTSVAKQATFKNAINLSKINLIGVYGTQSQRYALIRQANGRYKKVKVGDRIDGGRIEAITQNEVRYQKGGRLLSLKMPKG